MLLAAVTLAMPAISGAAQPEPPKSPRWTLSAEALVLDRVGTARRVLVERVPGDVTFANVSSAVSNPALNSTDLEQGYTPGFRLGAAYHFNPKYDISVSYSRIDDWDTTESVGPDSPTDWLVMKAPGGFFQTQDFSYQSMTWDYSTKLYNAELNVQRKFSDRIKILGGFRWLRLKENLKGTIPPRDRDLPLWKFNPNNNLFDVARIEGLPGIPNTEDLPPFWDTTTKNDLYGIQAGADAVLFERGRFSVNGLVKAGGYWNHASESTGVSIQKKVYESNARTDHAAFVGEAGLRCKYQVTKSMALKLGYEMLWLEGVALAPGQIEKTYCAYNPISVTAQGVNTDSGTLFHGVTAGLEVLF
ncbi:MAG: Lpg1974 family pore-forming outer membrane protein [Candidatus Omnitrophota bacterium]